MKHNYFQHYILSKENSVNGGEPLYHKLQKIIIVSVSKRVNLNGRIL